MKSINITLLIALSVSLVFANARADTPIAISVDAESIVGEMRPIWVLFGCDEALTMLTPEGQHLLRELQKGRSANPIQVRVHHLLTLKVTLPWVNQELKDTRALMGDDFWPYGLKATSDTTITQTPSGSPYS